MSDNHPPDQPPQPTPPSPEGGMRTAEEPADAQQGEPQPAIQPRPIPIPPQQLLAAQLMAAGAVRPAMGVGGFMPMGAGQLVIQAQAQWQGQYPPPQAVEHYEKVLPGSFNRMIAMAEQLQAAQIAESKTANEYVHSDTRRGHWLGFMVALLAMAAGLAALALNYPWVAGAFISLPVMGVAKALIDSVKQPSSSELLAAAANQPTAANAANSPPTPPVPPAPTSP